MHRTRHTARKVCHLLVRALCITLVLCPPISWADDWSVAIGKTPSRNGSSSVVGPSASDLLWSGGRDSIFGDQPVCASGLVVSTRVVGWDAATDSIIVAQDLTTGLERWATVLPVLYTDPGRSRVTGFRDGRVYATRASGAGRPDHLFALDPTDGTEIWRSEDLIAEAWGESIGFAEDGDILARSPDGLMRIDGETGETVWNTPLSIQAGSCGAATFGQRVYVWERMSNGPRIRALDVATGAPLYAGPILGTGTIQQVAPFVGPDGTVYAPRSQGDDSSNFLVAYEDTGSALVEKWRGPLGFVPFASFAVANDGCVFSYATARSGSTATLRVLKLDPATGSVLAESSPLAADYPVQPKLAIDAQGKVFVTNGGYERGRLFALDSDLSLMWSVALRDLGKGGPMLAGEGVLVVTGAGTTIYAYRSQSSASLGGTVILQQRSNVAGMQSVLEFREPGTLDTLHSCLITLDAEGRFEGCTVPSGTYDLALRFPHFLRSLRPSVTLVPGENVAHFLLLNGDVDDDNAIGLGDLNAVLLRFSTTDPAADRDGDGAVGLSDMNLVMLNFGLSGAP